MSKMIQLRNVLDASHRDLKARTAMDGMSLSDYLLAEIKIMKTRKLDQKTKAWDEARKRYHLSQVQAQMARELGMNPAKLGKIANHKQEPWKLPLPEFIEELYRKRFGRAVPLVNAIHNAIHKE